MPVAAEVAEVELVQRGRVRERQLALLERRDQERWRVLGDVRQLLLGAVQVLDRAAVVVLVVGDDQPLGQPTQLRGVERQWLDGVHGYSGVAVRSSNWMIESAFVQTPNFPASFGRSPACRRRTPRCGCPSSGPRVRATRPRLPCRSILRTCPGAP